MSLVFFAKSGLEEEENCHLGLLTAFQVPRAEVCARVSVLNLTSVGLGL